MNVIGAAAASTTDWLDPVIIAIIVASSFLGLMRGLLRSIASLVGIVLAALFAGKLAAYVDPTLKEAQKQVPVHVPTVNATWAFVIAFLAIIIAVEIAANMLVWLERIMLLGWVDRLGGTLFGLARGVLLCMFLLAALVQFNATDFNKQIKRSTTAVWLWENVPSLANMLPPGMKDSIVRLVNDQAPFIERSLGNIKTSS